MLSQAPNRSFLEQHTPHYSSHKYIGGKTDTTITKPDSGIERTKSEKGIS